MTNASEAGAPPQFPYSRVRSLLLETSAMFRRAADSTLPASAERAAEMIASAFEQRRTCWRSAMGAVLPTLSIYAASW